MRRRAIAVLCAAAALSATASGIATAEPVQPTAETPVKVRSDIPGSVSRTEPSPTAPVNSEMPPGADMLGACWAEGGFVDQWGVAHNHWVQVVNSAGGLWVWAGDLVGDENGNVPNHC